MLKALHNLYSFAKTRFLKEFYGFGFDSKNFSDIEKELQDHSEMTAQSLLAELLCVIMQPRNIKDVRKLHTFIREFQALANHYIYYEEGGGPISKFLDNILISKEEWGKRVPVNLDEYLSLCLNAHKKVDQFLRKREHETNELMKGVKKAEEQSGFKYPDMIEIGENQLRSNKKANSIIHYVLDWYLQIRPFNAYRKDPQKLAAIAIYIADKINRYAAGCFEIGYTSKKLAEFGGWAGPGSISSVAGYDPFYGVIYNVENLEMLLVDPIGAPKNWRERLKKLAPSLDEDDNF